MLGNVNGQNVFEQFTVISLQVLHILLFLCEEEKQRRKPRKWRAEKKKHKREIEISVYQFTEAESKSARTESTGLKKHFHCPKKGKSRERENVFQCSPVWVKVQLCTNTNEVAYALKVFPIPQSHFLRGIISNH